MTVYAHLLNKKGKRVRSPDNFLGVTLVWASYVETELD